MRSALVLFSAFALTLCFTHKALAQVPYDPVRDTTESPLKSYHGSEIDHIELATGNLSVKIPLISYPQRGGVLHLNFYLSYSGVAGAPGAVLNKYIYYRNYAEWLLSTPWQLSTSGGIQTTFDNFPILEQVSTKTGTSSNYVQSWILDQDGSAHSVGWMNVTQGRSLDGTGFYVNLPTSGPYTIVDRDGVTTISNSSNGWTATDPNGNQMTLSNGGAIVDTMGRQIGALPPSSTWTVPGINGGTETFTFGYSSNLTTVTLPNNTTYSFQFTPATLPILNGQKTAQTIPLLTKVTLPTGGSISYAYTSALQSTVCSSGYNYYFPILSRSVDANDGTGPHTWTYSYNGSATTSATTTVVDPLGNKTVYTYGLTSCHPYPTQIQRYDKNGNLLQTETKTYTYVGIVGGEPLNVNLTNATNLWANGQESQKSYSYDRDNGDSFRFGIFICSNYPNTFVCNDPYGNTAYNTTPVGYTSTPWTVAETDYGNGSPGPTLRQTNTTFIAFSGPNASSYLANNILTKPYTVQTLNGSGSQMAFTQYNYDESAPVSYGLGTTHQWTSNPPAGSHHGNNTSTYHWLNSGSLTCQNGSSGGSGSNLISRKTYYDTGMLLTDADPCGNTSILGYSPSFWGTYPTTITNALGQATTYNYDFNSGLVTSTTDPNLLVTSYSYENMWRLSQVNHPDGGIDTITYQESSFPFTSTHNKQINPSQTETTASVFDGLGRIAQTQLTSDQQGVVYTDTTYDALGRAATISNPYRKGTDITTATGTTIYGYDALGRKTSETYPDNSVLTTAYCGPSTLVTDPTGRWRRSRTDGLGRLVEVDEPNAVGASVVSTGCPGTGEPIWVTSYSYDTLGNLTSVLQNGSHSRSFSFDSLSRLLTSSNPEVGSISYAYWPDGAAHTKTDARSIATTYLYDALHREISRTYSNSDPTVTTTYDQSACLGLSVCQNIGHRTSMTDAAGSESWAHQVDKTDFPNMPNLHKEQRTTNGITKPSTYYADFAGNIAQVVYPTGRTVNYAYDSANRPSSAIDSANGITYAAGFRTSPGGTCLNNVPCYTPQGTFYALSIGQSSSFTGLNLTHTYNNRLQPNEFKASSTGGNAIDITYNFVDAVSGRNAGHVYGITNNLDSTRSQTFTYDQLNRITGALTTSTYATSPTHCWGERYQFDNSTTGGAWGNLTQIAATTNPAYTGCSQESGFTANADGNNRLTSFSYDASGNTQSDGVVTNYQWDAESQLKSAAGVSYTYDGDGRRVSKVGSKLYWYGSGGDILAETDTCGNTTAEYIFFGGKRIAMIPWSGASCSSTVVGNPIYYVEDLLGTSRVITTNAGVVCYDADFYPYGGERAYTNTCPQNYKFEGKERDTETGNDDFGARYYSNRFGRFMSPDSPSYSKLSNPQSWNLYALALNDPVTFRDADGHKIDCANNAQQCQQDAANSTGNAQAAARVTTETTKHGWWIFKWTETSIKITGDINSFRALSPNASKLADLVTSKDTVTVSYDQYAKPSFWANGIKLNGGSTSYTPSQGYDAQAFIDPTRTPGVVYDQDAVDQGLPQANTAEEFGHEVLGHIWGEMFGGASAGTRANMRDSIQGENAVRALDPTRGQKGLESHHNYNEMPPDPPKPQQ